ncbi:MAG: Nitrate reductase [Firmicutes bacterium]|nr:Nitrate reductase [Bacillota bacterium]
MATCPSICPYDCPDACGLLITTDGRLATAVQGDPCHPFTNGTLCVKMNHYERTVHSPERLTTPLLRSGPKGANHFTPVSWEKAVNHIADRWQAIIAEYGPEAILPCSYAGTMGLLQRNAGHAFFYQLGASRLERTICSPAKGYGWKAIMGSTLAPHPQEVKSSDLIILWGSNAAATNIHFLQYVKEAKKNGAVVWLIDTYETPTAGIADQVSYGRAKVPFISIGSGLSRYGNGAMTVRTILCLPALTGAWTKPGGGATAGTSASSAFAMGQITREDFISTPTRSININQLGMALTEIQPPLQSLYVYHGNPAAVCPDQNRILKGLEREDLFTVVHERFLTDTARYADVILPATSSLEHSDLYCAYGHYCLRRVKPVIAPVGQARSNWDVFQLLAQKMGFHDPFFAQSADEAIDELITHSTNWLDSAAQERLMRGELVELSLPDNYKTTFKTPSGKIEIENRLETATLPEYFPPHGGKQPLCLMTAPSVYGLNSSFLERADLLAQRRTMDLLMNPQDAADRKLHDRQTVIAYNELGEVEFQLTVTTKVPPGVVVAEGVWGLGHSLNGRTVNALVSPRLTDKANGSTFYDTKVEVRA